MNYIVDTHFLVERFLAPDKLSSKIRSLFSDPNHHFIVPSISVLEIQYLTEIGRIDLEIGDFLITLKNQENFNIASYDESIMLHSLKLTSNRDPFDRIILAHAMATSSKIITKDRWMKKTAPQLVIS